MALLRYLQPLPSILQSILFFFWIAFKHMQSVKDDVKASFSSFLLTVAFSKNHGYQGQIMDWKQSTIIIRWCMRLNACELLQDLNGSRRLQFTPVVVRASVEKKNCGPQLPDTFHK